MVSIHCPIHFKPHRQIDSLATHLWLATRNANHVGKQQDKPKECWDTKYTWRRMKTASNGNWSPFGFYSTVHSLQDLLYSTWADASTPSWEKEIQLILSLAGARHTVAYTTLTSDVPHFLRNWGGPNPNDGVEYSIVPLPMLLPIDFEKQTQLVSQIKGFTALSASPFQAGSQQSPRHHK